MFLFEQIGVALIDFQKIHVLNNGENTGLIGIIVSSVHLWGPEKVNNRVVILVLGLWKLYGCLHNLNSLNFTVYLNYDLKSFFFIFQIFLII